MIPLIDLGREYSEIASEVEPVLKRVLASGNYILGPEVTAFEKELASYLDVPAAVGLNSGTDAILLALRALDIKAGDEVIVPATSFIATVEPIVQLGAVPVFVDIDAQTYNMDPALLQAKLTPRTKAIIVVHLYGQAADMDALLKVARGVPVIEDMAQSIGAKYKTKKTGGWGTISCLSFFPTKNLGACGDGGAVVSVKPELADRLRMLRAHGSRIKYHHEEIGYNSRLDELQAAILRIKLRRLDAWNALRRQGAAHYRQLLQKSKVVLPHEVAPEQHIYHLFAVRSSQRDALKSHLDSAGIASAVHYPVPLPMQQALAFLKHREGDFPVSEALSKEVLCLPLYAHMPAEHRTKIAETLLGFEQPSRL